MHELRLVVVEDGVQRLFPDPRWDHQRDKTQGSIQELASEHAGWIECFDPWINGTFGQIAYHDDGECYEPHHPDRGYDHERIGALSTLRICACLESSEQYIDHLWE